jgi:hypothetical protein
MVLIVTITSETRNSSTLYDDIQAIADAKDSLMNYHKIRAHR